jgi:hypothetical protein
MRKQSDDGNLIFSSIERDALIQEVHSDEIAALLAKCVRRYVSSKDILHGLHRYCLWMNKEQYEVLKGLDEVKRRVDAVKKFRNASTAAPTRAAAKWPWRFFYVKQPVAEFIGVPDASSSNRTYFPVIKGYAKDLIVSHMLYHIPYSDWMFGIISSRMHLLWIHTVAGRLINDIRYAGSTTYNTFPFPTREVGCSKIEEAARGVIAARSQNTLAHDYGDTMSKDLKAAHAKLDRAVEAAYRKKFANDDARIIFLLDENRRRSA